MKNKNNNFSNEEIKKSPAFDAFLNLLNLITVGWLSFSLGAIAFALINHFMERSDYYLTVGIKFSLASIIIIAPIYLLVINWLHQNYKNGVLKPESAIHRWLIYLMLLVSALTIIGRLIYQLFRLLDGDYALAIILRTAVIFIIALSIFGYYYFELVRKDYSKRSIISLIGLVGVIIGVVAAVVGGFIVAGSPAKAKAINLDFKKVEYMDNLTYAITDYYKSYGSLPENLNLDMFQNAKDPETGQPFEYKIVDQDRYQLCANFLLPSPYLNNKSYAYFGEISMHQAGYQCFNKSIDNFIK